MDKLISADSLWMTIIHAMDYCEDILEFIEKEPEAVVRCKDCIHYGHTVGGIECQGYCKKTEYMTKKDDDFCSWGERV